MIQSRGAMGTVEGCSGYSGGAVGTVEGCGGCSGGVRWVQWRGARHDSVTDPQKHFAPKANKSGSSNFQLCDLTMTVRV